jgi:N12 class adenine-specific DNA methylase
VATKLQNISELARQTTERLAQSVDNWKRFLDSAAWLYKYPFHEQVLIHAQRPDAKACAPIELWNSRFRRWVNRGAKGIALIDDSGHKPALRYVFDVSDTNTRYNIPFRLWQTKSQYTAQIIEELQNHFGDTGVENADIAATVLGISINAVSDNYRDYYAELLKVVDNSTLADMSDDEISSTFVLQLMTSVSHTVLVRMGIDPAAIFHGDEYESITLFNSPDTIVQLGTATSDISEMILRQIERSVRSMERQERGTLANVEPVLQNEGRNSERSDENGTQLQAERGLPDSRYQNGRSAGGDDRQIRQDAEDVSQGASERDLQLPAASEQADGASVGDRQDGAGTGRTDDGADGTDRERDREDESRESDALDSANEQHSAESRGDGAEQPNLRITTEDSLFPTLEEQIQHIEEAEAQKLTAFSVSQADIDNELCRHGSGFANGKLRIYKFFEDMPSSDAAITFLKKEYGIGGHSHTYLNGESGFVDHDGKGLHFSNYNYKEKHTITWKAVARRLRELIAIDRYLTEKEKAYLPEYEAKEAERRLQLAEEAAAREALRAAAAAMDERRKEAQYAFSLGDTVQLGATTYTILGYDEHTVMLSDPKYPLLSEDMARDVFERRLRENPANDHLIIETEPTASNEETESKTEIVMETVEVISAEKNHMPYDVVIQTLRTEEREPEKPAEKTNFRITDDALGHGGPKAKFRMNMDAIRTLQTIEFEQRLATPEEQEVLSRYVGWGSLPQVFEENNAAWADEFRELYETLSPEEYQTARASVLNAHYTSPTVIKAMYTAIENMGFRTGNILEPSCGIGNFFGLLPESMAGSRLYGVELDSITGRIAKQLYQNANIVIQGYEATSLPDSFFDVAIGNVPFGDYGVADKRYDKNRFLIHDYFFAKTLDKVRPGGIVAFITSSGTMDKKNPAVRKYIAQRADLLGAIRLPNNAFLANAGTGVVADILFLQKRDRPMEVEPDWVHLGKTDSGYTINQYFVDNPDMVLGELTEESTQYGKQAVTVKPIAGAELSEQLSDALANIHAEITELEQMEEEEESVAESIPADPSVRNFSFTVVNGEIYYRENSVMHKVELSVTAQNRIKGMVKIRDCTRKLIEYQLEGYPDHMIEQEQRTLNHLYDEFTAKYGLLNSRGNNMAFSDDSSYCLLCSLEVLDENGSLVRKADMFSKRTIRQQEAITSCDTATDALALSLSEKAMIDMDYMAELTGKNEETLFSELKGVIFLNPLYGYGNNSERKYLTADEYLSGNVREKLAWARKSAEQNPDDYLVNVEALEKVQPIDLSASEIDVRLGATWLPQEDIQRFMVELLKPAYYASSKIKVHYSPLTAEWNISNKNSDYGNVTANVTYGTKRINGYKIIEETLNLKDVRIFDTVQDENGNDKRVLNKKETVLAQQKQQLIKDAFRDWIWKDPARRERLTTLYNERFNSVRPREYDGSHIKFVGMNPEITLRKHQVNAIARILYGGNTLLAHVVGAGKTFEMVAAAMESKRLGLCQKSLFVVPNHLTEQWAAEFLQLYPSANILVATKKDFETRNRKKFCSRIATGDYDAVIIGHSQFEKIPMSVERQRAILQAQLDEIIEGISEAKRANAERFTIKQMEKSKRSIKLKLDKLNDQTRKDDVVTFEELGVDRLFVDEAHSFKNLFLYTKMRNVAGLAQTEAQKSSDLFMKCRYMDELTDNRGIVFATGTPISNSMTEMYTMQRYLQYDTLRSQGLQHFDAWASTFGETITAIELAPAGTGYRAKTRFARFYNLPELISMFKQVADVQTADMLKLPVPEAEYHNEVIKPSKFQTDMVASFSERAEKVRNGMVDATVDNMLKITNDGRKLALDQRLTDDLLPDDPESKVNLCLDNIHRIWESSSEQKSTQLVFCDLSTPHGDGKFNVYDDLKAKLIRMGVPETEIAFIHDAKTEAQKAALFTNVRAGNVRIFLGSTAKMGAGTNVQKRLIAEHHLDIPWRPSDIEQREGRILRQGNENKRVDIFRYVTENTFDSYMWQTIENKQKFISQIMTSKSPVRSCEDVDETALSYAEIKALATGNPHIKEKMDLEIEVSRLKLVKANYLSQKYALEDSLLKHYPKEIRLTQERIKGYEADIALYEQHRSEDFPGMLLCGTHYAEKKDAGAAILEACKAMTSPEAKEIGTYRGFTLLLSYDVLSKVFRMTLRGELSHTVELGSDIYGNIQRMENMFEAFPVRFSACEKALVTLKEQMENAKAEVEKPFAQEQELSEKTARLAELDALLNIDKRENDVLDAEPEHQDERTQAKEEIER